MTRIMVGVAMDQLVIYSVASLALLQIASVRPATLCIDRPGIPEPNDFGNQQVNLEVECYGNGSGQFSWSIDRDLIENVQIEYNCSDPDTETMIGIEWGDPEAGTESFSVPWDVSTTCVFNGCYEDGVSPYSTYWITPTSCSAGPSSPPISTPTPTPPNTGEQSTGIVIATTINTDVPISTTIATSSVSMVTTISFPPTPPYMGEPTTSFVSMEMTTSLPVPIPIPILISIPTLTPTSTPLNMKEPGTGLHTTALILIICLAFVLIVLLPAAILVSSIMYRRRKRQFHHWCEEDMRKQKLQYDPIDIVDPSRQERRPSISSNLTEYSPLEKKEFEPLNPQQLLDNEEIAMRGRDTASESLSSNDCESEDNTSKATSSLDADHYSIEKADDVIMEQSLEGSEIQPKTREKEEEKEIHLGDVEKTITVEDTDQTVSHLPQDPPDGYVRQETPFGVDWNNADDLLFCNSHTIPTHDRPRHVAPTYDFDDGLLYPVSSRDSSGSGYQQFEG